jgi:excinuclease UvrABC nuclease subunit
MQPYKGHHNYNKTSVMLFAPDTIGVYYCGIVNSSNSLSPLYIGRAIGENVTIRSRLFDHLNNDSWSGVTHFGYIICQTPREAEIFEASEIKRFQPRYNVQGKKIGGPV